jgi:hypothetical protein
MLEALGELWKQRGDLRLLTSTLRRGFEPGFAALDSMK